MCAKPKKLFVISPKRRNRDEFICGRPLFLLGLHWYCCCRSSLAIHCFCCARGCAHIGAKRESGTRALLAVAGCVIEISPSFFSSGAARQPAARVESTRKPSS